MDAGRDAELVLDENNRPSSSQPIWQEAGLSYDRVLDYDFSTGDDYWETGAFWSWCVSTGTPCTKQSQRSASLSRRYAMFMALFGMAGEDFESVADMDRAIAALLTSYVTIAPLTAG